MKKIVNPRFPHSVLVYRAEIDLSSEEQAATKDVILDSECRHEVRERAYTRGEVVMSNYQLALPRHKVAIVTGDSLEVTLPDEGRTITGVVVDSRVGTMGANIWYNEIKQ